MARQMLPADTLFGTENDQYRIATDFAADRFGNCSPEHIACAIGQTAWHKFVDANLDLEAGHDAKPPWNDFGRQPTGNNAAIVAGSPPFAALDKRMREVDAVEAMTAGAMNSSSDISPREAC